MGSPGWIEGIGILEVKPLLFLERLTFGSRGCGVQDKEVSCGRKFRGEDLYDPLEPGGEEEGRLQQVFCFRARVRHGD